MKLQKRSTSFLILSLNHNFKTLTTIVSSGMSMYYNVDIVFDACESIAIELRRRGVRVVLPTT